MRYAYARVSTVEQSLDLQLKNLKAHGYDQLFQDHGVSGTSMDRPGYIAMRRKLQPGDTLIVWRLDRMGRSFRDLVDHVYTLRDQGINFVSLTENIDLSSASGELLLNLMASFANFERALMVERVRAGMDAAWARGSQIGRPAALNGEQFLEALFLMRQGMTVTDTAKHFGIARSTMTKYLAEKRALEAYQFELENED